MKNNKRIIYCELCKYFYDGEKFFKDECRYPNNKKIVHIKESWKNKPYDKEIFISPPSKVNRFNDCKWFEDKFYKG